MWQFSLLRSTSQHPNLFPLFGLSIGEIKAITLIDPFPRTSLAPRNAEPLARSLAQAPGTPQLKLSQSHGQSRTDPHRDRRFDLRGRGAITQLDAWRSALMG